MSTPTKKLSFLKPSIHLWGLITAAGTIVATATLLAFLSRFAWFFDLLTHFRVQYFYSLLLAALILLVGQKTKTAITFGVFALINALFILPFYFGSQLPLPSAHIDLRAMFINVHTNGGDPVRVASAIKKFNPDFVLLEEVDTGWLKDLSTIKTTYPHILSQPRSDNFGIALFSKTPFANANIVHIGIDEVPSVRAEITFGGTTLTILGIHALPPAGKEYSAMRNKQLQAIPAVVKEAGNSVLLLGDLNVTPWSYHFRRLIQESGLRNSARGRGIQPTWPTTKPPLLIPLDHCLHSPDIYILDRFIGPHVGSDHLPVIIDLALTAPQAKVINK